MQPAVEYAEKTHPGRDPDKQVNEDSNAFEPTALGFLAVVCDGMGGHASGQEASRLAVQTIVDEVKKAGPTASPTQVLEQAITLANARVHDVKGPEGTVLRPGSTCVAVLVHANGTFVAHVGDSRAYLVHAGAIQQITKDHSKVQLLVDAGYITPEEAKTHPEANQITRALGIAAEVNVEVKPEPILHAAGDVFVLCSDGLSDLVMPEDILRVADSPAPQAAGQLVDLANARGGHDNITVQIVRTKVACQRVVTLVSQVGGTWPDAALGATVPGDAPRVPPTAIDPDATAPVHVPLLRAEISADSTMRTQVPLLRAEQIDLPPEPATLRAGVPPPRVETTTAPPSTASRAPLTIAVVIGGALLFAALIALLYYENQKHRHVTPVIVHEPAASATTLEVEDAAVPTPSIERAEPLPSVEPSKSDPRRRRKPPAGP